MNKLAIMPLEDYQNLCNNIRELTGTTDVIKSGDLVEKVGDVAESGEDVTDETNAYTNKLATLETAITALETELESKASGDSGSGNLNTCTIHVSVETEYQEGGGYITVTQLINGNIVPSAYIWLFNTTSLTIENVICGSVITCGQINQNNHCVQQTQLSYNMTYLEDSEGSVLNNIDSSFIAFNAPAEPNTIGEIILFQ